MTVRPAADYVVGIVAGAFLGIGWYAFLYATGYFYLLNHPAAPANWLEELTDLTADIKANKDQVTPHQRAEVSDYRRRGQSRIDFIIAENSMAFHAPRGSCPS